MTAAVFTWSWHTTILTLTGPTISPLILHTGYVAAVTTLFATYLLIKHPTALTNRHAIKYLLRQIPTPDGARAVLMPLQIVFFVWATHYITPAAVVTIHNAWLILFVLTRSKHDQTTRKRHTHLTTSTKTLLGAALLGAAFVALAQPTELTDPHQTRPILYGTALAALSATCGSWFSHRFRIGENLHTHITQHTKPQKELPYHILTAATYDLLNVTTAAAIIGIADLAGWYPTLTIPPTNTTLLLILTAATLDTTASIIFRHTNLNTKTLGTNLLLYTAPLLTLTWLTALNAVHVHQPGWLAIGAAGIIATNTLFNTPALNHQNGHQPTHSQPPHPQHPTPTNPDAQPTQTRTNPTTTTPKQVRNTTQH